MGILPPVIGISSTNCTIHYKCYDYSALISKTSCPRPITNALISAILFTGADGCGVIEGKIEDGTDNVEWSLFVLEVWEIEVWLGETEELI